MMLLLFRNKHIWYFSTL